MKRKGRTEMCVSGQEKDRGSFREKKERIYVQRSGIRRWRDERGRKTSKKEEREKGCVSAQEE